MADRAEPEIPEEPAPMFDVHAAHAAVHTWRDFFVHIAIITIGLLIAIALEQGVEHLHHLHQRHQLQQDLLEEAKRNRDILTLDLGLESQAAWFREALGATKAISGSAQTAISLPLTPCIPGTLGANGMDAVLRTKYFAPSDAVWVTARDAGLISHLPVEDARMYARLAHNYSLQAAARDRYAAACERIDSLHTRYATAIPDKTGEAWSINQAQANEVADAAATADTTLRALMWRTRWNLRFEEGIMGGAKNYDEVLINLAGQNR
jgi:hypothetical protein